MQLIRLESPTGYSRPPNEVHPEFPKWLHFKDGPSVLVQDAAEEAAVLGGGPAPEPIAAAVEIAPVPILVGENNERDMLLQIAEARGIRVDRRWKTPKIRAAVEAASPRPEG